MHVDKMRNKDTKAFGTQMNAEHADTTMGQGKKVQGKKEEVKEAPRPVHS